MSPSSCIPILLAVLLGSCCAVGDAADRVYVKSKGGGTADPRVVIKDVCAWPNLTVLGDGTIVASIFNQPSHGSMEGDVECWASSDEGATWELAGTPAVHDPGTNRMNVAAGLAENGDLIVIASGWAAKDAPGSFQRDRIIAPWICRSTDGGKSWMVDKSSMPATTPDGAPTVPFGDILRGEHGDLLVGMYAVDGGHRSFVYRSSDDGTSWGDPVAIGHNDSLNETALFHLGDGQWLAAARTTGPACLQLYRSSNDAKAWTSEGPITGTVQHPGHLLRLSDRSILLSYGNRTPDDKGVDARRSIDEGRTWSKPQRICDFRGDGGYPSSVQLSNGEVLTAYYASESAGHKGYHMGVVRWDPHATRWEEEASQLEQ